MSDQQQPQQDDEKQQQPRKPQPPQQGLVPVAEQDFLEQDPPVRGQNYVCMSFLSPEKILRNKDVYYVSKFLGGLSADVQALFEGLTARFEGEPAALDMLKSIRGIHDYLFDAKALELTRAIAMDAACLRGKCEGDHDLGYEMMKRFMPVLIQRLHATRLQILDVYGVHS